MFNQTEIMIKIRSSAPYISVLNHSIILVPVILGLLLSAIFNPALAAAQRDEKPFRIALGGYALTTYESTMSLTEPTVGAGVFIDPNATLGLDTRQTVFRVDGHYRFTKEHSLSFSWYNINSTGNKSLEDSFEWIDDNGDTITIPVAARVDTKLDYDIIKLSYLWTFYHTDKVELDFGGGLHLTRIATEIRSDVTSSGVDARDVSTSLPLPVISIGITYHVTPSLSWYTKSEIFSIALDDWEGTYTDIILGMEYRVTDNFGIGIGLGSNTLKLTEDARDYKFRFENRITGLFANAAFYY